MGTFTPDSRGGGGGGKRGRENLNSRTLIIRPVFAILQTQISTTIPQTDILSTNKQLINAQTETETETERERETETETETERDKEMGVARAEYIWRKNKNNRSSQNMRRSDLWESLNFTDAAYTYIPRQ